MLKSDCISLSITIATYLNIKLDFGFKFLKFLLNLRGTLSMSIATGPRQRTAFYSVAPEIIIMAAMGVCNLPWQVSRSQGKCT